MKVLKKIQGLFLAAGLLGLYFWTRGQPLYFDLENEWQEPSKEHLLGLGENGLNLLKACFDGALFSVSLAVATSFIGILLGTLFCAMATAGGLRVESRFKEVLNFLDSFPNLIVYLVLIMFVGNNLFSLLFILSSLSWVHYSRFIQSFISEFRAQDYIIAARALGLKPRQIVFRHLFPQFLERYPALFLVGCRGVILTESFLSFLGFTFNSGQKVSLGALIFTGQRAIFKAPHAALIPALFLAALLLILQSLLARFQTLLSQARER